MGRNEAPPTPLFWLAMCVVNASTLVLASHAHRGVLSVALIVVAVVLLWRSALRVKADEQRLRAEQRQTFLLRNTNAWTVHGDL